MKLATVEIKSIENDIIIKINFKLPDQRQFKAHKIYEIPRIVSKDWSSIIRTGYEILAVSLDGKEYALLNGPEWANCQSVTSFNKSAVVVCPQQTTIQTPNSNNCDMFNGKTNITSCEYAAVKTREYWIMLTTNHWLFQFNTQQNLTLQCNGFNEVIGICNFGIINFLERCVVFGNDFKIPFSNKLETKLVVQIPTSHS